MKHEKSLARMMRGVSLLRFIFFACLASAAAQTVIPRVCVEASYQTGTVTLAADATAGSIKISVNGTVPTMVSLVINPGGQNEEQVPYVTNASSGGTLYLASTYSHALEYGQFGNSSLASNHTAGEPVRFAGYHGTAYFGYQSTLNSNVTIPRSFATNNFFFPGPSSFPGQPALFTPGIHEQNLRSAAKWFQQRRLPWHLLTK